MISAFCEKINAVKLINKLAPPTGLATRQNWSLHSEPAQVPGLARLHINNPKWDIHAGQSRFYGEKPARVTEISVSQSEISGTQAGRLSYKRKMKINKKTLWAWDLGLHINTPLVAVYMSRADSCHEYLFYTLFYASFKATIRS